MKGFRYIVENGLTWVNMSHVFRSGTNSEDTIWVLNHIFIGPCGHNRVPNRSTWVNLIPHPHLPWYLHWYCFCFVSFVHDIFIPMHHPSRTRCDRRYHANPTRIGCLIRRRRSYLCSRRFGEHSALIDVLWDFLTPSIPFKWLLKSLKSGFLI